MKPMRRSHPALAAGILCAFLLWPFLPAAAVETGQLRFAVYLDERPIGWHHYQVIPVRDGYRVRSEARLEVKLLFLTAYRYEHSSEEYWRNGCLERLHARTDDNGTLHHVEAEGDGRWLRLTRDGGGPTPVTGCVMTFAYWNPAFIGQTRLLNAQTGELMEVTFEPAAATLPTAATRAGSRAYRLSAGALDLTLWYSESMQWLGLESRTGSGRLVRYLRSDLAPPPEDAQALEQAS